MGACFKLSKWLVFIQNFIFFLAGAAVIGLGIYYLVGQTIPGLSLVKTISIAIVSLGGVVLIISFLGCCGSAQESRCMLSFYWALVFILTVGTVVIAVLAFTNTWKVGDLIDQAWQGLNSESKKWIYDTFQCCGFTSPDDDPTVCDPLKAKDPGLQGCKQALIDWGQNHLVYVEIALGCAGGVFLLGLVLTCGLICGIKHKKEEHHHHEYHHHHDDRHHLLRDHV